MKHQNSDEQFDILYRDENKAMLTLFCASLISSNSVLTKEDCLNNMEILQAFKLYIEKQENSEKQQKILSFIKTAESILENDLNLLKQEPNMNNI